MTITQAEIEAAAKAKYSIDRADSYEEAKELTIRQHSFIEGGYWVLNSFALTAAQAPGQQASAVGEEDLARAKETLQRARALINNRLGYDGYWRTVIDLDWLLDLLSTKSLPAQSPAAMGHAELVKALEAAQIFIDFQRDYSTMPAPDFHRKHGLTMYAEPGAASKMMSDLRGTAAEKITVALESLTAPSGERK